MEENSMIYVKVENGIIIERISGSAKPEGYELDSTGSSKNGEPRAMWDSEWNPKTLSTLVSEKLVDIPEGYKLIEDSFVEMTTEEKVSNGIIKPTDKEKIVDGKIVSKTMDELYADGLVSKDDYNAYIVGCRVSEYHNSDKVFWDYQEDKATKEEWIAAKQEIRDKYKKVE
jgi:hypothetical protein